MQSRETILKKIDELAYLAESYRQQAAYSKSVDVYLAYLDRADICNVRIKQLEWVLNDEEADKMV